MEDKTAVTAIKITKYTSMIYSVYKQFTVKIHH